MTENRTTHEQPDPDASSDGDGSWTEDEHPAADPDLDRGVDAVIRRQADHEPAEGEEPDAV